MKYQAYPEYKDSGGKWIDELPVNWCLAELRRGIEFLTDFESNGSFADVKKNVDLESDSRYAWYLRATDLQNNRIGMEKENRTCDKQAYRFLSKTKLFGGEFLVAKRGEIGKIYIVPSLPCKATLAPNLYLIRLNNKIDPKFVYYWFSSVYGKIELELANKSTTIGALYKDDVRACKIILPSRKEQNQIANFLDYETQRIDTLIEEKKDFIKLLKEKRLALISHAVTKGLDNGVKMKASGVDWLGEVPEHWQVKKIKHLFQIRKRTAGKLGFPVLSITQQGIKVKDTVTGTGQLSMDYSKYQIVKVGDFAMNHMDLLTGYVDLSPFHGVTSPDYRVFTLIDKCSVNRYYLYLMQMGYKDKIFFAYGQGVANIGRWRFQTEAFSNFNIPYPSQKEQQQIVDFLDRQLTTLDNLVEETQTSIELLKEHRTALISAAVTGKIDVRDFLA